MRRRGAGHETPQASTESGASPTRAITERLFSTLVVLGLAVLIAGAGITLTVAGAARRSPAANLALVDQTATRRVIAVVSGEVNAAFSYSYTDIGVTRRAAASALTGSAARQYRLLFSQVLAHGPAQKLTLTSRVVRAGVISLSGGTAQVLLFLDQKWVRGASQPVAAAAQLDITARLSGGRWRITTISAR